MPTAALRALACVPLPTSRIRVPLRTDGDVVAVVSSDPWSVCGQGSPVPGLLPAQLREALALFLCLGFLIFKVGTVTGSWRLNVGIKSMEHSLARSKHYCRLCSLPKVTSMCPSQGVTSPTF